MHYSTYDVLNFVKRFFVFLFLCITLIFLRTCFVERRTINYYVELSDDGNYLAVHSTGYGARGGLLYNTFFYDLNKKVEVGEIGFDGMISFTDKDIYTVYSSVYGYGFDKKRYIYNAYLDNRIYINYIDIKDSLLLERHNYYVRNTSFQNLLFFGNDSLIYLIDTDSKEVLLEITLPENVVDLNISGDDWESLNLIYSISSKKIKDDTDGKIEVFSIAKEKTIKNFNVKISSTPYLFGGRFKIYNYKYLFPYPYHPNFYPQSYNDLIRSYNIYPHNNQVHIESFEETSDGFFETKDYYVTLLENRAITSMSYCPAKKILAAGYKYSEGKGFVEGFLTRGWRIRDDGVIVIYDVVSNEIIHTIYNRDLNLVPFTIEKNPDPIVIDDNTRGIKAVDLRKPIE